MKYMGSKRYMLKNGLGMLIGEKVADYQRFVDLFCGAGYVSRFVAEEFNIPVLASDLQVYATTLTGTVVERTKTLNADQLNDEWILKAKRALKKSKLYQEAKTIEKQYTTRIIKLVKKSRILCEIKKSNIGPIWGAYGGHYFSPVQALSVDYLIKYIPQKPKPHKIVCLAALITAASKCVAAPGHTAQPFQPTCGSKKYLHQSWQLDLFQQTTNALEKLSQLKARKKGQVITCGAEKMITRLSSYDLVFIDPPYSDVQYSRFYHVLETIARGQCGPVEGKGRYPSLEERPQSAFSNRSESRNALENLINKVAERRATVILTFPNKECSNGLSGKTVKEIAEKWFEIKEELIHGKFSTLGGNNHKDNRPGRQKSEELLLFLQPKKILT